MSVEFSSYDTKDSFVCILLLLSPGWLNPHIDEFRIEKQICARETGKCMLVVAGMIRKCTVSGISRDLPR